VSPWRRRRWRLPRWDDRAALEVFKVGLVFWVGLGLGWLGFAFEPVRGLVLQLAVVVGSLCLIWVGVLSGPRR
jgi:hypothetical protein